METIGNPFGASPIAAVVVCQLKGFDSWKKRNKKQKKGSTLDLLAATWDMGGAKKKNGKVTSPKSSIFGENFHLQLHYTFLERIAL